MRYFLVLFFLLPAFSMKAQYVRYTKAYGKRYVYIRDVAKYYNMTLYRSAKGCELRSRYSRVVFNYDKRNGIINGVKVTYLNAPYLKGAEPMMSEHDFLLFLDPILRKSAIKRRRIRTIMIDPGHGKQDSGAVGLRYKEKNIALQIARRLRDILKSRGYRVVMTRSSDVFPSLRQRTDMCNTVKPDLFISIHCNSASSKTASGIETYCMTPAGEASSSSKTPEQASQNGNRNDKANARFAYTVQKYLLRETGAGDRGVKFARFFVLKNILCPGILIENGFMSNPSEEKRLGTPAYQYKLAKAIADGIADFAKAVR